MAGLCEGGNESSGSLKAISVSRPITCSSVLKLGGHDLQVTEEVPGRPDDDAKTAVRRWFRARLTEFYNLQQEHLKTSDAMGQIPKPRCYNGWEDHRANHTIPPFWLDDRPPLLRHVGVRPVAGSSFIQKLLKISHATRYQLAHRSALSVLMRKQPTPSKTNTAWRGRFLAHPAGPTLAHRTVQHSSQHYIDLIQPVNCILPAFLLARIGCPFAWRVT
ncbi:hypothetical protein ANN_18830 [Periplaneta americana]|uniref:Uncharacterized protein n=1 Tax=Periplaneta americana TaxID=6978 RepID=A0ABQ8SRZ5_PERAM|nr:hypothetical protein ANN_18830 [Periplaneta americana]